MITVHFIGPKDSGKSALIKRYIENIYRAEKTPTHGIEMDFRCFVQHNAADIKIEIIDTPGEPEPAPIQASTFYRDSHVFFLLTSAKL